MTYETTTEYPATEAIAAISDELSRNNWHALKEDYLNPGLPSSLVTGWSKFENASRTPSQIVQQWVTDWENQAGDVLRYAFEYRYEHQEAALRNLSVTAVFIPAPIAKETRKETLEFLKKKRTEKTE